MGNVLAHWTSITVDGIEPPQMRQDQLSDKDINPIMQAVEAGIRPKFHDISKYSSKTRTLWHQFQSLVVKHGVLYRKFIHVSKAPEKDQFQLVLPAKHVNNTIKHYHGQLG